MEHQSFTSLISPPEPKIQWSGYTRPVGARLLSFVKAAISLTTAIVYLLVLGITIISGLVVAGWAFEETTPHLGAFLGLIAAFGGFAMGAGIIGSVLFGTLKQVSKELRQS